MENIGNEVSNCVTVTTLKKIIALVDGRIKNYQKLVSELGSDITPILIDNQENAVATISNVLRNAGRVDALHIFAHGRPGGLLLGNALFDEHQIDLHRQAISTWHSYIHTNGRVFVYGCQTGAGTLGERFVSKLSEAISRPVEACSKDVGASALGGTWELDVVFGASRNLSVPKALNPTGWVGLLQLPLITIADASVVEAEAGSAGNRTMEFVVTLSEAATTDVFIDYQTVNGKAKEEVDVNQTSGTLTIAAGQTSGVIAVTAFGDALIEADETFVLELTNPRGAVFAEDVVSLRAAGTILDNDGTGNKLALFVDNVVVVEGDAGTREAVFLVRLSRDPATSVTLDFTTTDGSAVAGVDYVATTGSVTFLPGGALVQEVRVPVIGDVELEGSELCVDLHADRGDRQWCGRGFWGGDHSGR